MYIPAATGKLLNWGFVSSQNKRGECACKCIRAANKASRDVTREEGGRMKEVISGGFAILFKASVTLLEHASLRHWLSGTTINSTFCPRLMLCMQLLSHSSAQRIFTYAALEIVQSMQKRDLSPHIDFYSKQLCGGSAKNYGCVILNKFHCALTPRKWYIFFSIYMTGCCDTGTRIRVLLIFDDLGPLWGKAILAVPQL